MKKHEYYIDGFPEIYGKLKDVRSHIEKLTLKEALAYDGCMIIRDGEPYRLIDIVSYYIPCRIVIFRKLRIHEAVNYWKLKGWS